jgi:PEGA domain-containing protein
MNHRRVRSTDTTMFTFAARRLLASWWLCALALVTAGPARADAPATPAPVEHREADKHFEHGVALYMEADYRAALVEFLRAYELSPNVVVLFNVGETQYQLRDYASALATFERYLAESSPTDGHRLLVENNVRELRTRVGRLTISSSPLGAEVSIDDRVIGRTPFEKPVIVGIGRLSVRAYLANHLPVTRTVDVAAEDNLAVNFDLPPAGTARTDVAPLVPAAPVEPPAPSNGSAWRKAGWITAGMLLAGAAGVGLWARDESMALRDARDHTFPAKADSVKTLSTRTLTLSVIADSLAAAALVVGGVTLYSSLTAKESTTSTSTSTSRSAPATSTRLSAGVGSLTLEMTF